MLNIKKLLKKLIGAEITKIEIAMWPPKDEERFEQEFIVKIYYSSITISESIVLNIDRNMWSLKIENQNEIFGISNTVSFEKMLEFSIEKKCDFDNFFVSEYPLNDDLIGSQIQSLRVFYIDEIENPYGISFILDKQDVKFDFFAGDDGGLLSTNKINLDFNISTFHESSLGESKYYTIS